MFFQYFYSIKAIAVYPQFFNGSAIIKNAKSPLLDGLHKATFPMAGVSQVELAGLIRLAGCELDNSIGINQHNINTALFYSLKKSDSSLNKLSRGVKKLESKLN